ncbi:S-adenosyl-L-methionine-dependent methyltransferase [Lichtheimia hyalospora FSU 10163]|nr:S-adenosyl-L-methionine-dependent methyltransferase [Lichtheimia hyalospora FSU 10163]
MTSNTAFAPSPSTSVKGPAASSKDRHYYNRDDVAYLLPGDNEEDDRLDRQHWGIKLLCGNSFGAPVSDALEQGITVLDSGCGPGTLIHELSKEYPKSKFHGVDIATHPREAIELPNCEFHVHNILRDPIFPDNHFGFIHQRLLVLGLPSSDWEKIVATQMRLLKPGGWIELTESMVSPCENAGPCMKPFLEYLTEYGRTEKGLDFSVDMRLDSLLKGAGAVNITKRKFFMTLNHGEYGKFFWRNFQDIFHAMKPWVIKIRPDLDDPVRCEKFLQECAEECKEYKTSAYLIRCYGQKPSTTSD